MNKRIIWSSEIDEEWITDLHNEYPDKSDDELYEIALDCNWEYLFDERINLDIDTGDNIIVIGDLGLWNGRVSGYREIGSNIRDCLFTDCDIAKWYVDRFYNLRFDGVHHDGRNHYLYRAWKPGLSDKQKDRFMDKIYHGTLCESDISRYTRRLGDYIGKAYGWSYDASRVI